MNWIIVNTEHIYEGEVLGTCLTKGYGYHELIVGHIHLDNGIPAIESEHELLQPVTHYIPVKDLFELKQLVK